LVGVVVVRVEQKECTVGLLGVCDVREKVEEVRSVDGAGTFVGDG